MRKPARPFVTEYKSRKPTKSTGLFHESMMLDEQPSDVGYDARYEEALRTAGSVFGGAHTAPSEAPETPHRTILSDLSYIDPVEERLAAASLVKRGRKPGSRNQPKVTIMAQTPPEMSAVAPVPATTFAASVNPRGVISRRQHVGFIKQLENRRATKPGDKWKLKLRGR